MRLGKAPKLPQLWFVDRRSKKEHSKGVFLKTRIKVKPIPNKDKDRKAYESYLKTIEESNKAKAKAEALAKEKEKAKPHRQIKRQIKKTKPNFSFFGTKPVTTFKLVTSKFPRRMRRFGHVGYRRRLLKEMV